MARPALSKADDTLLPLKRLREHVADESSY